MLLDEFLSAPGVASQSRRWVNGEQPLADWCPNHESIAAVLRRTIPMEFA
jgi:hypothetical protein